MFWKTLSLRGIFKIYSLSCASLPIARRSSKLGDSNMAARGPTPSWHSVAVIHHFTAGWPRRDVYLCIAFHILHSTHTKQDVSGRHTCVFFESSWTFYCSDKFLLLAFGLHSNFNSVCIFFQDIVVGCFSRDSIFIYI